MMECFLVFIAVLIAVVLVTGIGIGRTPRSSRFLAAYQRLAHRYGGSWHRPGWHAYPWTEFAYRSVRVLVRALPQVEPGLGRGAGTQLVLPWPDANLSCEIRTPPIASFAYRQGWQIVSAGPPEFARCYTIRADDPDAAADLLGDAVRWQIERLRTTPGVDALCIRFFHGVVTITKARAFSEYSELLRFVEASLTLYDQSLLMSCRGIEFSEGHAAQVLEQVVCKICGEEIAENLVFCRRCRTPHHRECWQYNGLCSTFGCGETEFDTPRVAPRLPDSQHAAEEDQL